MCWLCERPKPRLRYDHEGHKLVEVQLVPPGVARGFNWFSNHGLLDYPEITVWPKQQHYRLTTGQGFHGLNLPEPVRLNEDEKRMIAILGLSPEDLSTFLRSWRPENLTLAPSYNKPPQTLDEVHKYLQYYDDDSVVPEGYMTLEKAAELWNVSEKAVYQWVWRGKLESLKRGNKCYVRQAEFPGWQTRRIRRRRRRRG